MVSTPREQPIVIPKGYELCSSSMLLLSVPFRCFASDFASEEGHQISLEVSVGDRPWRRGVRLDSCRYVFAWVLWVVGVASVELAS